MTKLGSEFRQHGSTVHDLFQDDFPFCPRHQILISLRLGAGSGGESINGTLGNRWQEVMDLVVQARFSKYLFCQNKSQRHRTKEKKQSDQKRHPWRLGSQKSLQERLPFSEILIFQFYSSLTRPPVALSARAFIVFSNTLVLLVLLKHFFLMPTMCLAKRALGTFFIDSSQPCKRDNI